MSNLLTIYRRELGAYFNSAIAYIFMIVFVLFANGVFMMQFFTIGKADMRPFFSSLPYVLNIFIPAVAMRLWAEDRRGNTYELLLTFPMKPHELVLGKYLASLTFTLFSLAATCTVPIMIGFLGKIDTGAMWGGYAGVFLMAALFLAIGIFISNLCKDQIVAFILTMIAAFTFFLAGTDFVAIALDGWVPGVGTFLKNYFGLGRRIIDLGKGVIDLKDLVYFLVMIAVFLFLNGLSLEGRYRPKARLFFSGAVGMLLCSAVLVNWLIKDLPLGRFDMTEGKQYTVAAASVKILKGLKVPVNVKLFISPPDKMPTVLKSLEQDALDKLEELRVASGNKLRYQVVHVDAVPDEKDPMRQTLQNQGVVPFQVESVQKDEVGVKLIYSTLALQYKEKPIEVISRVVPQTLYDIEYQMLLRITKMTLEDRPRVAIFAPAKKEQLPADVAKALGEEAAKSAAGEYADDYKTAASLLRGNGYDVNRIALTKGDTVPEKTNMLMVLNPGTLTARQRYEINRYLRGGGTVIMAAQGFEYSFARQGKGLEAVPKKLSLDINTLTELWGVKVNPDVLMDKNSQVISISTGQRVGPFSLEMPVRLPTQINVPESSLNSSATLVNRISSLAYLWGSALDLSEDVFKQQGLKSTVLFTSSRDSWRTPNDGNTNLTEENTGAPAAATGGKYPLAVLLEGQFRDAFEGVAVPPWKEGEAEETPAVAAKPGRLLVIGCSQIFGENLIQNPGNLNLFANIVDGFMLGDDLIKIRAKSGVIRDIRAVGAAEKLWFKFFTVGLVPLLLFLTALVRIFLRKKEKEFYLAAIAAKPE